MEELVQGKIIGHTTDTVYGLMGIFTKDTVIKINKLKGRPEDQPLQLLVTSPAQLEAFIKDTGKLPKIENKVSYIVEASTFFAKAYPSFNNSIMFRVVDGPLKKIVKSIGPLFASSANKHGQPVIGDWNEVEDVFGVLTNRLDQLDGSPSKIISLLDGEPKIIRGE